MSDQENPEATNEEQDPTILEVFFEHQRKAATEVGKAMEGLVPTAIREHGSAAFKEMVEGYRQLFNAAIDQVVDNIEKIRMERKDDEGDSAAE